MSPTQWDKADTIAGHTLHILAALGVALLLAALVSQVTGCGPQREPCNLEGESRCDGQLAQRCGPDHQWYTVDDCAQVVPGAWACAPVEARHGCVAVGD